MTSTPSNNPGCVLCDIKWCTQGDLCGRRSSLAPKSAPIPALNNPTEDDLLRMSQIPLPEGTLGYYPPDSIRKAAARPVTNNLKDGIDEMLGTHFPYLTPRKGKIISAQILNLILDTILAKATKLEKYPGYGDKHTYIDEADLRTMLEGMKS